MKNRLMFMMPFSYNKFMKKNIIQKGLQEKNCVSTILYLNDLFNVNCHIYDINRKCM